MRHDVHAAALRAAAKLAFSVAFLAGCSNGQETEDEGVSSESAVNGRSSKPAEEPCPSKDAGAKDSSAPSCKTVLASTFGDAGVWPADEREASEEVKACCAKEVDVGDDFMNRSEYHWQCCSVVGWGGAACTPWGPPVPPSMSRRGSMKARKATSAMRAIQAVA